eukprot:CAMPEP_0116928492 /NCGR_PEP_ID=MMETSP0467-20121206/26006_1 /TAXON_ID=283647 /ORGANISM="Mesodinium pulex, Strain SPMC105" /LENGTH=74 /DNA_ID=CAMNT_0004608257 /DNA_START=495 /DNA_END=719 /DNA_ORIENTATION=+
MDSLRRKPVELDSNNRRQTKTNENIGFNPDLKEELEAMRKWREKDIKYVECWNKDKDTLRFVGGGVSKTHLKSN